LGRHLRLGPARAEGEYRGGEAVKTIRFKSENFDLLLQGPTVKSTTIRAGDRTKELWVGRRVEARVADRKRQDYRAVECELTSLEVKKANDLTDIDGRADGFKDSGELLMALFKLNGNLRLGDAVTIIGLRLVG
jgi:hypothetical protein